MKILEWVVGKKCKEIVPPVMGGFANSVVIRPLHERVWHETYLIVQIGSMEFKCLVTHAEFEVYSGNFDNPMFRDAMFYQCLSGILGDIKRQLIDTRPNA